MESFEQVEMCTDPGRTREHNEDMVLQLPGLLVLADGMGGHADGEVASRIAVDTIAACADEIREAAADKDQIMDVFEDVFQEASDRVENAADGNGMGTTLVVAVLAPDASTAYVAHVGDSRAYLLRTDRLIQVTRDHNVFETLISRGRTKAEAHAHPNAAKLVQAIGFGYVQPDVAEITMSADDTLLLCSDGLTDVLGPGTIANLLDEELKGMGARLVDAANRGGGPDNISVIIARVKSGHTEVRDLYDVEHLRDLMLFEALDAAQLRAVAPFLRTRSFVAGQHLTTEGEDGSECLILTQGSASVTRGGVLLCEVKAGTSVGELALAGPRQRTATVRAITDIETLVLTRDNYTELCCTRPYIGLSISGQLARLVASRLAGVNRRLAIVQEAMSGVYD